jgi:hypothetical protein
VLDRISNSRGPVANLLLSFDRIDDEIEHDLLQLDTISENGRQAIAELRSKGDAISS